jgi:hypothetical protein
MLPLTKILEWTTSEGTKMWAELYYQAIFESKEALNDDGTQIFIECLHLELYANGKLLGTIDDETINGSATTFVFEVDGKAMCVLDDDGRRKLVIFDGLTWEDLEVAWDALARAFNGEIWELRRKQRAAIGDIKPKYETL